MADESTDYGRDERRVPPGEGGNEEDIIERGTESRLSGILNKFKDGFERFRNRPSGNLNLSIGGGFSNLMSNEGFAKFVRYFLLVALLLIAAYVLFAYLLVPLIIILLVIGVYNLKVVRDSPVLKFFIGLIIGLLLIFLLVPAVFKNTTIVSEATYDSFMKGIAETTARFVQFWEDWDPIADWGSFWDKQVAYATGGYFAGQVEESKDDVELGIYLEDIEAAHPVNYEGEVVTVWATLRGKTLGDTPIYVTMDCNASKGSENKISSPNTFDIFSYEEEYLDCKFSELPAGSIRISFNADYNFETLGYTKAYFIDQDRLRALRRQNIDPLDEYGIYEKNPIAVYTNGPVEIGMGTAEVQPIPVKNAGDTLTRLGITLENRWEGKIKKVNYLEVQLPNGMELDTEGCDNEMTVTDSRVCRERCSGVQECMDECSEYDFYALTAKGKEKLKNIEDFITIRCPLSITSRSDLLGNAPISTRYIRVVAEYDYSADASKMVYIKKAQAST